MCIARNTEFMRHKHPNDSKNYLKKITLFHLNLHKITHFLQVIAYNY